MPSAGRCQRLPEPPVAVDLLAHRCRDPLGGDVGDRRAQPASGPLGSGPGTQAHQRCREQGQQDVVEGGPVGGGRPVGRIELPVPYSPRNPVFRREVAQALASCPGFSVIGGGETVAAASTAPR